MIRTYPRRTYRGNMARASFIRDCSAYRRAAREYGIKRDQFYDWLVTYEYRDRPGIHSGAGVLAFTGCVRPINPHDAALRTLSGWAPGLNMDMLAHRKALADIGICWPAWNATPTKLPDPANA